MADEVRHAGKHMGDRLEDALAHVVDEGHRNAEGLLDALQERYDVRLILRGQFHVPEHDVGERIDRTHQERIAPFTCGVQVTDIAAAPAHVRREGGGAPPMRQRQVDDELHAEQRNLARTDPNILLRQFGDDLDFVAMPEEQGFSDIDQHVVAEGGAGRRQALQFLGRARAVASRTNERRFLGAEWTHMQRADATQASLLDFQGEAAVDALRVCGPEVDARRLAEQTRRRQPTRQMFDPFRQRMNQTERGVFFSSRPWRRKKFWIVSASTKTFCFRRRRLNAS